MIRFGNAEPIKFVGRELLCSSRSPLPSVSRSPCPMTVESTMLAFVQSCRPDAFMAPCVSLSATLRHHAATPRSAALVAVQPHRRDAALAVMVQHRAEKFATRNRSASLALLPIR